MANKSSIDKMLDIWKINIDSLGEETRIKTVK